MTCTRDIFAKNHFMSMRRIISAFIGFAFLGLVSAMSQTVAPFEDDDRAVFLGNSITDGGHYHSYIWLYYMTRFPYMNLEIFNAGIGGNTAGDMYERLDGDVFSKRPTVLMVTFGMNDTGYMEYNGDDAAGFGERKYRECKRNFEKIEKRLLGLKDVRIVMVGGSPYDETSRIEGNTPFRGKNAVMDRVVAFQKEAAERNGWEFMDFSKPLAEIAEREQAKDSSFTLTMGDRIHPDNDGHMVMAYLFLKAQGFAGQKVADMEINAGTGTVSKSENCIVSAIRKDRRGISFDYLANSLPYPMDTVSRGFEAKRTQSVAKKLVPFVEEMNQEILKVSGLEGEYKLYIDDELIGIWSGEELEEGINLAEITWTPQYQQALEVMFLNEWRWELERNFRDYAWMQYGFLKPLGLLDANDRRAVEAIDKGKTKEIWAEIHRDNYSKLMHDNVRQARLDEIKLLQDRMYEINKPAVHRISLQKK